MRSSIPRRRRPRSCAAGSTPPPAPMSKVSKASPRPVGSGSSLLGARVPGEDTRDLAERRGVGLRAGTDRRPRSARSTARPTPTRSCRPMVSGWATRCSSGRHAPRSRWSAGWSDTAYNGLGGLWANLATWHSAARREPARCDARRRRAAGARGARRRAAAADLVAAIDAELGDRGFALPIPDCGRRDPGRRGAIAAPSTRSSASPS